MHCSKRHLLTGILLFLLLCGVSAGTCAQSFSQVLSFQGRLADPGTGKPMPDGQYQVTFKIYDTETDGSNLWQETQTVDQVGGVFSVYLGSVNPFPGELFADGDRWLGTQVVGDAEMPQRIQFTPAPWAIYAANSQPDDDWAFSGADIYRVAGDVGIGTPAPAYPLHVVSDGGIPVVYVRSNAAGARALHASSNGTGVYADGGSCGLDAYTASPTGRAVYAFNEAESGAAYAVYGENISPNGIAIFGLADNGSENTTGIGVYGRSDGDHPGIGVYGETTSAGITYGVLGVSAHGIGVRGENSDSGNYGLLGGSQYGVEGRGDWGGGWFEEADGSGIAVAAVADCGIQASGGHMGGLFSDADGTAWAHVGFYDRGIWAYGNYTGGYFEDLDSTARTYVAYGDRGIRALGSEAGGHFEDTDGSGEAYVGYGDRGIEATGDEAGGYFEDTDGSGYAYVGYGDHGIDAYGDEWGGYFEDTDGSGYAYVAIYNDGIRAYGNMAGGYFKDLTSGTSGEVSAGTAKIRSNGSCQFVQNHPVNREEVVVYAAPEGDEVATYTRGTARLVNGKAVVPLGETFKWVTNPDIGLTAHLTPRGKAVPLAVVSLTTEDLVVCGPEDGPQHLVFDYIVYGLRIGFEEVAVVQEKEREAYIPSMDDHRALYERRPELRDFNALERFKRMRTAAGETDEVDLTASQELHDAIVEFDPAIHGVDVPVQ